MSTVLPKPMPDAAVLPAEALLLQFSPKLTHVAATFEQASIEISSILFDRVREHARGPFRECACSDPSLHCAKAEIELPSDIRLAYTAFHQSSHLS